MKKLALLVLALALVLVACESTSSSTERDRKLSATILEDLQRAHPVPQFRRSQLRQNLVEITTAQAETTQTTTFFFNMGDREPLMACPSIGFPIPSTMQLTNPQQVARWGSGGGDVIAQVEPTGVFTGDTTGTYAICVNARGDAYAVMWEGFTMAVTGPAEWNGEEVSLVGPPSFEFTIEEGKATIEEGDEDYSTEEATEDAAVVED